MSKVMILQGKSPERMVISLAGREFANAEK